MHTFYSDFGRKYFNISNRWLYRFWVRTQSSAVSGESANVSQDVIIINSTRQYIFYNNNKMGLFYITLPDKSLAFKG